MVVVIEIVTDMYMDDNQLQWPLIVFVLLSLYLVMLVVERKKRVRMK